MQPLTARLPTTDKRFPSALFSQLWLQPAQKLGRNSWRARWRGRWRLCADSVEALRLKPISQSMARALLNRKDETIAAWREGAKATTQMFTTTSRTNRP
eukprot:5404845-Pleurochrysis_carterae.AAC.8